MYKGVLPRAQHRTISKLARTTNYVERFNCTLRQRVSRLVRATLSFSQKLANHVGAIKYFICDYNLARCAALPGEHYQKTSPFRPGQSNARSRLGAKNETSAGRCNPCIGPLPG